MTKGEETRARVLRQAAQLFNQQGYFGASLADVTKATGLAKGGLYNYFESKDQLALEAFDYAVSLVNQRFTEALEGKTHAADQLAAIISVFRSLAVNPPVKGGCPVLNTAIESDDAHPALRKRARQAMDHWRTMVNRIVSDGVERQELRAAVDPDSVATIVISTLEGAVMLSKLYRDPVHMQRAVDHLLNYVESSLRRT